MYKLSHKKGMSLVEAIVGVAIVVMAMTALVSAYNVYVKFGLGNTGDVPATYLLNEGVEAVYLLRDGGWAANIASLTPGTKYYFSWDGSKWVPGATGVLIDNRYERYFTVSDVFRDGNGNIAPSGTFDAGSKKIIATVSWNTKQGTTTKTVSTYLSNIFGN